MKAHTVILRSISVLMLALILHTHVCSAFCALNISSCCKDDDNDGCDESTCSKSERKTDNCQTIHFFFFNAVGQFHSIQSNDIPKTFSFIADVFAHYVNVQPFESSAQWLPSNTHSPPPKEGMRVFIQSFQV